MSILDRLDRMEQMENDNTHTMSMDEAVLEYCRMLHGDEVVDWEVTTDTVDMVRLLDSQGKQVALIPQSLLSSMYSTAMMKGYN